MWRALASYGIRNRRQLDEEVKKFSRSDLHLLVSHFLHIRFPIVVGLNKCDEVSAPAQVERVRRRFPSAIVVEMSAKVHCDLLAIERFGRSKGYLDEEAPLDLYSSLCIVESKGDKDISPLCNSTRRALSQMGKRSAGVEEALLRAFTLKSPVIVLPVIQFDTFLACVPEKSAFHTNSLNRDAKSGSKGKDKKKSKEANVFSSLSDGSISLPILGSEKPPVFRETLIMRHAATTWDAYVIMKKRHLIAGEYVRAERWRDSARVMKKSERISEDRGVSRVGGSSLHIVRVTTTQRSKWQQR